MKDFFDTWKFKILVAVAVFLVGIMAYAGANGRLTAAPQELLGVVLMPLQKVTSALSGGIGSVWEKYTSIDEVMEQNEQLEAENAELRQQIVDYDRIKAENEAYKALARIQDSNTEASYISAFVIGRDPLDEFGGFTLDCGTVNGAAVNDAVISDKGYLIGMVVEADTTSCKVMTILHPSFSAAGVVSRTRENGIINGSTDYAGDGLCVLTNLERATETKMGDQVITTGLGGVFPPDLLVGTVQKVEPEVRDYRLLRGRICMESRRMRSRSQILTWVCYAVALFVCAALQTTPGLLQLGQAKPLFILPLCLAVAVYEGEFAGALFGAVSGLLWDYTAGRTVGMLALELLLLCFALSVLVQVYLQGSTWNFALISTGTALVVLSLDWLFFYYMPGYSWALSRWLTFVLPSAMMTLVPSLMLFSLVRHIYSAFKIDNGVV